MTLAERLAEPDVAALPDWQAAEVLNTPEPSNGTRRVDVSTSDARALLLTTGEWPLIAMAAEPGSGAPDAVRGACILVRDTLSLTSVLQTSVSQTHSAITAVISSLVQAGLVAQATADALLGMTERPMSWAEANGMTVDARAVGLTRGGE